MEQKIKDGFGDLGCPCGPGNSGSRKTTVQNEQASNTSIHVGKTENNNEITAASFLSINRRLQLIVCQLQHNGRLDDITQRFGGLQTNFDRVKFYMQLEESRLMDAGFTASKSYVRTKSAQQSEQLRSRGNESFQRMEYLNSIVCYTRSIMAAPNASEQLALGYGNRSAALRQLYLIQPHAGDRRPWSLQLVQGCTADIKRALAGSYPVRLRYKLCQRLGIAQQTLGIWYLAELSLVRSIREARSASLHEEARRRLLQNVDQSLGEIIRQRVRYLLEKNLNENGEDLQESDDGVTSAQDGFQEVDSKGMPLSSGSCGTPALVDGRSDRIPAASSAVELSWSQTKGRLLVARRNLQPGDTVIVEDAFCWDLELSSWESHCYQCGQRTMAGLPCTICTRVLFCSDECREEGHHDRHQDCSALEPIRLLEAGSLARLAVRTALATDLDLLRGDPSGRCAATVPGATNEKTANPDACNLVGHSEQRTETDLFRRTVTAVSLAKIILPSKIKRCDTTNYTVKLLEIATGILHFLQSLPCNAHTISEQRRSDESEVVEIGAAVYPTVSLMNHSCDPNIQRVSYGTRCVVRVIRPIAAGDEILDNYGFHSALHDRETRQQYLREQYFFSCRCQACQEDWRPHWQLPRNTTLVQCSLCKPNKNNCQHHRNRLQMLETSRKSSEETLEQIRNRGHIQDPAPLYKHLIAMDQSAIRPCLEYKECQEAVKFVFFSQGNAYCCRPS